MIKIKYFLLSISLAMLSSSAIAQEAFDQKMSIQQSEQDFELFKKTLNDIHPNLHLYISKSELDALISETEKVVQSESLSPVEFFRKLTPIIHAIRNSHTIIKPPKAFLDYINSDAKRLPMSFLYKNDSLIIVENYGANKNLSTGDLILRINDIPTKILLDSLSQFTFTDGNNRGYSDYISTNFLSKRYAYFLGLPSHFDIDFLDANGTAKNERVAPLPVKQFYPNNGTKVRDDKYSFSKADGIAFLTIKDFIIGDVNKFGSDLNKYFKQIAEESIDYLIVDLRDNLGGNPEATNKLLSFLVKESVYPIKEKYALVDKLPDENFIKDDAYKYFHKAKMKKIEDIFVLEAESKQLVKPCRNNYLGNLLLLINENCASATTSFLGQMRTHRPNALFVGNTTLGNPAIVVADYTISLNLPNSDIIVKIPLVSSEKNVSFENPGTGVAPDILVQHTMEEMKVGTDICKRKAYEIIHDLQEQEK